MGVGDQITNITTSIENSMDVPLLISSSPNPAMLQSKLQNISSQINHLEKLVNDSKVPFQPMISELRLNLQDLQRRLSPVLILVDLEGLKIPKSKDTLGYYDVNYLISSLLDFIQEKGYLGYFLSVCLIVGDATDAERIQPSVVRQLRNLEQSLSIHENLSFVFTDLKQIAKQVADSAIGDRMRYWRLNAQDKALLVLGVVDGDFIEDLRMIELANEESPYPKLDTLLLYPEGSTNSDVGLDSRACHQRLILENLNS